MASIRSALKEGDEHLNTIPLALWDKSAGVKCDAHKSSYDMEREGWPKAANSPAVRTCILKRAATRLAYLERYTTTPEQREEFGEKVCALAEWLEVDAPGQVIDRDEPLGDQFNAKTYDENIFEAPDGNEYMILTDEEADQKAADNIRESVWVFNAEFLASHMAGSYDFNIAGIKAMQEKCESANDDIRDNIEDMDAFIEDAISADGRARFLTTYDDEEAEYTPCWKGDSTSAEHAEDVTYFIYRMD